MVNGGSVAKNRKIVSTINLSLSYSILLVFLIPRNMEMVKQLFYKKLLIHLWLYVKKRLNISILNISTFSMVLCLFLLYLMEIFPKTHDFWSKNIVKHCSTVVKYVETTINSKFSTVNHYLTNDNTKKWLRKEQIIM